MDRFKRNVITNAAAAAYIGWDAHQQTGDARLARKVGVRSFFYMGAIALTFVIALVAWIDLFAAANMSDGSENGFWIPVCLVSTVLFWLLVIGFRRLLLLPQRVAYDAAVTPPPIPGETWYPEVGPSYGPSGELRKGR
jgi:hypothetical protein